MTRKTFVTPAVGAAVAAAVATGTTWKVEISCGNHGSTWVKVF